MLICSCYIYCYYHTFQGEKKQGAEDDFGDLGVVPKKREEAKNKLEFLKNGFIGHRSTNKDYGYDLSFMSYMEYNEAETKTRGVAPKATRRNHVLRFSADQFTKLRTLHESDKTNDWVIEL